MGKWEKLHERDNAGATFDVAAYACVCLIFYSRRSLICIRSEAHSRVLECTAWARGASALEATIIMSPSYTTFNLSYMYTIYLCAYTLWFDFNSPYVRRQPQWHAIYFAPTALLIERFTPPKYVRIHQVLFKPLRATKFEGKAHFHAKSHIIFGRQYFGNLKLFAVLHI